MNSSCIVVVPEDLYRTHPYFRDAAHLRARIEGGEVEAHSALNLSTKEWRRGIDPYRAEIVKMGIARRENLPPNTRIIIMAPEAA